MLFKLPFESMGQEGGVLDLLRQRLPGYQRTELPLALPEAAVLMPLVDTPEPRVILTVRSSSMPTHAGEVAFPGGKRDPEDKSLLMTALRETEEEVGLSREYVDVLGQLSPIASRYGMKVTPFVGIVHPDAQLQAEPGEIETIFQVPLTFFLEERPELSSPIDFFGRRFRIPSYYYEDKRIWGLTAFMILDLINHVYDAGIEFDVSHWPEDREQ
ncbi:MAG: CoA pyrophosphatase [Pseudomonadota bacterium]|nr:CoA pyrophosphatase [Pseudomonadota bacterium]MEE3321485.1 CoA pyrophosphatase [Pseudomonadota bacterium]